MKRGLTKIFTKEVYSKPAHKKYLTNKTLIKSINDTWKMDILHLNDYVAEKIRVYR